MSYTVIDIKGTLIKAKAEKSDHVVTRNILHFRRIQKKGVFRNSTSNESGNDFHSSSKPLRCGSFLEKTPKKKKKALVPL